jgi:DNA-binding MarR family transcriptional regulator
MPSMAEKKKGVSRKGPLSISARSVDTKRVIRISNGVDAEAFGGIAADTALEWRQYTFGRLLLYVFNAYESRILESYRAAGFPEIRQVHFAVMRHIDIAGGTRVGDLATRAGISKGAMGQLVAEFEQLGFIKTAPDPADARAKLVELSKRGRALMQVTHRSSKRIEAEFAKKIGAANFAALRTGLVELRQAMVKR